MGKIQIFNRISFNFNLVVCCSLVHWPGSLSHTPKSPTPHPWAVGPVWSWSLSPHLSSLSHPPSFSPPPLGGAIELVPGHLWRTASDVYSPGSGRVRTGYAGQHAKYRTHRTVHGCRQTAVHRSHRWQPPILLPRYLPLRWHYIRKLWVMITLKLYSSFCVCGFGVYDISNSTNITICK